MAVSATPSLPNLQISSKHNFSCNHNNSTRLIFSFPCTRSTIRRTRPAVISSSQKPRSEMATNQKRELLEQYGLNPDDYMEKPPPKTRRRNDMQKEGRGKKGLPEEKKVRQIRETHKLLQVLGGKAKRKKLLSPKGMDVRPMMEVVKGAAFAMLQAAGGCPASLRPGRWLDLYSGTGSVGIEAISRGCSEVHFVEMDPWVVSDILRPNLEWTGFLDVSVIHTVRVESFLDRAEHFVGKDGPFDYVSVTPPYTQVDYGVLMNQVATSSLIGEDTLILVEYPSRTDMLDTCGSLIKIADRRFGRTHLAIYGPVWAKKKRKSEISHQAVSEISA